MYNTLCNGLMEKNNAGLRTRIVKESGFFNGSNEFDAGVFEVP